MIPTIQQATKEDIYEIHRLVYELAVYEKEPESMVATVDEYMRAFEKGLFEALIAKDKSNTVGMALYCHTFSTWKGQMLYLEDFYVIEEYRHHGIGQLIFDEFLSIAQSKGVRLTKWQVLDWNETALKFYKKNNAVIEKNWWNGKIFFD